MYAMQPITYTTGTEIQSPYRTVLQPGNIESGVALGPTSRLAGECLARHVSQPGMCWGKFSSQNTRSVDQYDPGVYGALETQWALASTPLNTVDPTGNFTNTMSYAGGSMNNNQMAQASASNKAAEKAMKDAEKAAKKAAKDAERSLKQAQKAAAQEAAKASRQTRSCTRGGGNGSCSSCG